MLKAFTFYKNCPHRFTRESHYPLDMEDPAAPPVISMQDEFNTFTTKKRTETRTDKVDDSKSETTSESMSIDIKEKEMKPTNIEPKASTSNLKENEAKLTNIQPKASSS